MEPIKRNKININATVSPYLSEKMVKLVADEKFSSVSDLVSVAITEFLMKFSDCDSVGTHSGRETLGELKQSAVEQVRTFSPEDKT